LRRKPDQREKQLIRGKLTSKLGVDDDLSEFYEIARRDGILKHVLEDLYGMHDTQSASLFGAAILAIWCWMAFFYVVQYLENLSRKVEMQLRRVNSRNSCKPNGC
jgi:hypothetical protein